MRLSHRLIMGLGLSAIMAGCATDFGDNADSGNTNTSDISVSTDRGNPLGCSPEIDQPQGCVADCNGVPAVGLRYCQPASGTWGSCQCTINRDAGTTPDVQTVIDAGALTPDVPVVVDVQPTGCNPGCQFNQTCTNSVCVSNCPRACIGGESCLLLASAGWSCVDVTPDAGPTYACNVNQTLSCACPGGVQGAQTCLVDRSAYGPCQCGVPDAGTPTSDVPVVVDVPVDAPFTCPPGTASCDENQGNGCEVNTRSEVANCGSCGNVCPARANGAAVCLGGRCDLACTAGFQNCNGTASDGCETDTRSSLTSCGTCGTACPTRNNATATCSAGACGFTCLTGYADCNGDPNDGCEINTRDNEGACGRCGTACGVGQVCSNGSCQFTCSQGDGGLSLVSCPGGATCISLVNNLANCGACGRVCNANIQAHATCTDGRCGNACNAGFGDCDNVVANGCERELVTDPENCGRCGNACPVRANAAASCVSSSCGFTCNAGFGDCNAFAFDGCETDVHTSTQNCGACGRSCPSGQSCSAGACVGPINPACPAGQSNCGSTNRPICLNLANDHENCGGCGWWCYSDETCASGNCRACPSGQLACGNVCRDVLSDATNCGACGRSCPSGQSCSAGACVLPCPSGQTLCGSTCRTTSTDPSNCGSCGTVCPVRANANGTTCLGGSCGFMICSAGFGDCNANATDGCETMLNTNANCGLCGRVCGAGTTCSAGNCVVVTPVDAGTPDSGTSDAGIADAGTPDSGVTDAGPMSDVMTAPISCGPGLRARTMRIELPPTIPAGCGSGSSGQPILWGQYISELIALHPGTTKETGPDGFTPIYAGPLPLVGAPLAPLPLEIDDSSVWTPGTPLHFSGRCGSRTGVIAATVYDSFGTWVPFANFAAAGGHLWINVPGASGEQDVAAQAIRMGNHFVYITGAACIP